MGTKYQFTCKHCNYETVVSGGDDVGMRCRTTTISCQDCGELFDVVTSDEPWDESAALSDDELVCPGQAAGDPDDDEDADRPNPGHRVQRWEYPGPCPKCGQPMTRGRVDVLWD